VQGEQSIMQKLLIVIVCAGLLFIPAMITNSQEQPAEEKQAVPVCLDGKTIFIPESKLQEHLDRGATQGACPKAASASSPEGYQKKNGEEEDGEKGKQEKVIICHKGRLTLSIAKAAVPAHLKHGDTLGACPESSDKKGGQKKIEGKKTEDKGSEDKKSEEKKPEKKANQNKGKGKGKQK
jgi:hypothetical protein